MSDLERIVRALLQGVVLGSLVAAGSLALQLGHVWPGSLLGGALAALTALSRSRGKAVA